MRHPEIVTGIETLVGIARDVKEIMTKEIEACVIDKASDDLSLSRPVIEDVAQHMQDAYWEVDEALQFLLSALDEAKEHYNG